MRKVVEEFEGRMSAKVRRQEKLDMAEEFKEEYLRRLERNW